MITKYTTYIKENDGIFDDKFKNFLYDKIDKKLENTDYYISTGNNDKDVYIVYNDPQDRDTDMFWIPSNEFNIDDLQISINNMNNLEDSKTFEEINKLLQEVIDDIKTNYMHLIDANKFDLL